LFKIAKVKPVFGFLKILLENFNIFVSSSPLLSQKEIGKRIGTLLIFN
jgi:hypothetical protein